MRWLSRFRNRALVFGLPILAFAVLAVFPQRYLAVATMTPSDPSSMGLSATLGQLGASNSVFGNQAAIEIAMRVANGVYVRDLAIKTGHLDKALGKSSLELERELEHRVDIRSLRGGIIMISTKDRDPKLAKTVVSSYTVALRSRLGQIAREQSAYKRKVLEQLVDEASKNYAKAQANYDTYRRTYRTPNPQGAPDSVNTRLLQLQGAIDAQKIALSTARQFYTDDNIQIRQLKAEMASLQEQLNQARSLAPNIKQDNVGSVIENTTRLFDLERKLGLQRSLYDSYQRFLEGTLVENIASDANLRILEPPYIETDRQYWMPGLAALAALILLWGAIEFYRLRPPVGARLEREDTHA
ncbi:hypothetical protein HT136_09885 [Novosphingobium profundi]|uniref:hypothetical protein n=1 Tax=Novosphingobium profundi TaxID=1774954 RepID=UPI001BDB0CDA|nr:hypothetical protein [Novosphingobium profundi]MBT0668676.1 hypothetical protein [Novosphingobium profundi]